MSPAWFRPWMIWAAIVLAMAAFAGVQTVRLADERAEHATTVSKWAKDREDMERNAREAVEAARTEEQRRAQALQGVIDEAEKNLARSRADAVAASDAGDRLRQRIAELTSTCRSGSSDTVSAGAGQTTQSTADLLADVQRRLDDATDTIARFADQAHAAGTACQRSHSTLTPPGLRR